MSARVYVIGVGMTHLGKFPDRSIKDLTADAVDAALADADLNRGRIEAAWFGNTRQGVMEGQNTIRGQCALRAMGFAGIPIANVENACASSSTGLYAALAQIKAGFCDIALVAGAEKMVYPDRMAEVFAAFRGGWDVHTEDANAKALLSLGDGMDPPPGTPEAPQRSLFMEIYAAQARFHMRRYGTTQRQIAAVAAKNHRHSTMNPKAQYRFDQTVEQVLADIPVCWPLTRAMCAPISDGAGALILCGESALRRVGAARAIEIKACALASGTDRAPDDLDRHIGRRAALAAYERAGVGPEEMDVAEVHDASAFAEVIQTENLGLVARGDGGPAALRGETKLGGRIPVNPSGGLISKGHPIGATGALQIVELVTQLRGEAGPRQVEGARLAVAENGGGFHGYEEAATTVTILAR